MMVGDDTKTQGKAFQKLTHPVRAQCGPWHTPKPICAGAASALREYFAMDADGQVVWIKKRRPNTTVGGPVGTLNGYGYMIVRLCGRSFRVHHIAWFLHYGKWPSFALDHIDGDRTNNRVSNLRPADQADNMRGFQKKRENTSSQYRGVSRSGGKWRADIQAGGKTHNLGRFDTEENAARAYDTAALRFGFYRSALNFPDSMGDAA